MMTQRRRGVDRNSQIKGRLRAFRRVVGYEGFAKDCVWLGVGVLMLCLTDRLFFRVALAVLLPFVVGLMAQKMWKHWRNADADAA